MVVEAAVGWWAGSLALVADAGHMLADAAALGLALMAQSWGRRPPDARRTYGHRRLEVLAAFVNGLSLTVIALWIVREAIVRWLNPVPIRGVGLLSVAILGLVVNLTTAAMLHRAHRHSINVRAAFLHVLGDALGSVGAIVAGVAVVWFGAVAVDPLVSCLVAILVAASGWRVLRDTSQVLLEAVPQEHDVHAVEATISACDGVASLHDLHLWRIHEGLDALTVHVVLAPGHHGVAVVSAVVGALRRQHGLTHVTVQPEAPIAEQLVELRRGP
jgi:cobalt-zinc-cadmium efflux system protein